MESLSQAEDVLTIREYQELMEGLIEYPLKGNNPYFPALSLAGRAGNVCSMVAELIRFHNGQLNADILLMLQNFLMEVLGMTATMASELELSLSFIAMEDIKRRHKHKRDTLRKQEELRMAKGKPRDSDNGGV